jgi:acyl-CoA thioesterase FadM
MLELPGSFVTKTASMEYMAEILPFQGLVICLNTAKFKKASFDLVFRLFNKETGNLVGKGFQRIAFSGPNRKITRIPTQILAKMMMYLE